MRNNDYRGRDMRRMPYDTYEPYDYETYDDYDMPQNRFRDTRGRDRYNNGRYAPEDRMIGYGDRDNMRYMPRYAAGRGNTSRMERGGAYGSKTWVDEMKNADGTTGPHWSLKQVETLMQQRGVTKHDPEDVWLAMNAEYSDRCKVNKKYGMISPEFYLDSAIAFWLEDEDAVDDKLDAYYECCVRH